MTNSAEEKWADVPGYEGRYEVSDAGRVRALARKVAFGCTHRMTETHEPAQVRRRDGYLSVGLGHSKQELVHRLVLMAFRGVPEKGAHSRHLNGTKDDNRLSNLAWGTAKENAADKVTHGTNNSGSRHGKAKLNEAAVRRLRAQSLLGGSHRQLAEEFGISRSVVSTILAGKAWRHACAP